MDWELVTTDRALADLIGEAEAWPAVAVDTEFMRRNTFYPQEALLQLCFDDRAYLIDPLAISDFSPIQRLWQNPDVVKVLHSASEDLEVFQRWLGVLPDPMFDTQRALALLNRGFGLGYSALVMAFCEVDLPKGETRSDWLQRPLTESQCHYAAQDVAYLLPVWRDLQEDCRAQNKLDWVYADSRDACANLVSGGVAPITRIKTAWKLSPHQQAVLRAVCDWRERTARSSDKPRGWIIDDKECLQIAQTNPVDLEQLQSDTDLHPKAVRRYGASLLDLLDACREQTGEPQANLLPKPLEPKQRQQLKRLKAYSRNLAEALNVAPEALLAARDYEALVRESGGDSIEEPLSWRGWRAEPVIEPLRKFLNEELS